MMLSRWFLAISCVFGCVASADADTAYTNPIGGYAIKVPGKAAGENQRRTYFGMQLLPDIHLGGTVANVSGKQFSVVGLGDHNIAARAGYRSYVHVFSGTGKGFISDIEQTTATQIQCEKDLTGWVTPGTVVQVRTHLRLGDLFGTDNKFHLAAGSEASAADNVVLWDPENQRERVYYYHSGRSRWEEEGIVADADAVPVRYPYGLYVIRRSEGTLRIGLSGSVATNPVLLPVKTGTNVFSLPVNFAASLNLISTAGTHRAISGPNAKEADLFIFEEPTSGVRRGPFYHSSRTGSEGWREAGVNGAASTGLDLLSTLVLQRQGDGGYLFVDGNTSSGEGFPVLPADPEPGELAMKFSIPIPPMLPGSTQIMVETSQNLVNWGPLTQGSMFNNRVEFDYPPGQSRAFYRLKVTYLD
ncbi:MAG TPA: hypothetical protein VM511_09935 [Luteolibacter sp.]|nr:hypothetical protein [Luteolibacter sp.]